MKGIIRLRKFGNYTSLADALIELIDFTSYDLYKALSNLIQEGEISLLLCKDDGSTLFHDHTVCQRYVDRFKEVF